MSIPPALTAFENSIASDLADIASDQASYKATHGKCQQIKRNNSPVMGVSVTEYVSPQGAGYEVELERAIGQETWRKFIDNGALGRSKDWFLVEER